jgi:hypothetical protein
MRGSPAGWMGGEAMAASTMNSPERHTVAFRSLGMGPESVTSAYTFHI